MDKSTPFGGVLMTLTIGLIFIYFVDIEKTLFKKFWLRLFGPNFVSLGENLKYLGLKVILANKLFPKYQFGQQTIKGKGSNLALNY